MSHQVQITRPAIKGVLRISQIVSRSSLKILSVKLNKIGIVYVLGIQSDTVRVILSRQVAPVIAQLNATGVSTRGIKFNLRREIDIQVGGSISL